MRERSTFDDIESAIRSMLFGAALPFFVLAAVISLAFCAGRSLKSDATIEALRDTVRIADSVVVLRTDTVVKYQRRVDTVKARSDALDSVVVIVNDSTVLLKDSAQTFNIPPLVIADLHSLRLTVATQDTLIRSLYGRDSTQEWRIATRDKMIRELSRTKFCDRKCAFVGGVAAAILIRKAIK